jgi:VWFA-related protein
MPLSSKLPVLALAVVTLVAAQEPTFRANVPVVLVPVTVTDRHNKFGAGLTAGDFTLLVDGKPRAFQLDTADAVVAHLAIAVVVQTNDSSREANLKVRKIGSLIQPLVAGDRGRVAVLGYGESTTMLADFTHDPNQITAAFRGTATAQNGIIARQLDAVLDAARLLSTRPPDERKVIIIVGESKDRGSRAPLNRVVEEIQRQAITVYAATWSPYKTALTTRGTDTPNAPAGVPDDVAQQVQFGAATANPHVAPQLSGGGSGNILAGAGEIARLLEKDSARYLVEATGGEKLSFATLKKLEQDVARLGQQLHSQYMLSFPANDATPGYHTIEVQLRAPKHQRVQTRAGYYTGDAPATTPAARPQ